MSYALHATMSTHPRSNRRNESALTLWELVVVVAVLAIVVVILLPGTEELAVVCASHASHPSLNRWGLPPAETSPCAP